MFQRRSPASWKSSWWRQRGGSSFACTCSWQRRCVPHWRRTSSCSASCSSSWIVRNESSGVHGDGCRAQVLKSSKAAAACPNTSLLHLHARGDAICEMYSICQPAAQRPRAIWMRAQERDCSRGGQMRPAMSKPGARPRPVWMRAQERACSRGHTRPARPVDPSTSRSTPRRAPPAARATRRLRGSLRSAAPAVHHGHKHRTAL